jgi:predicted acylesterase/phospholipase RssA
VAPEGSDSVKGIGVTMSGGGHRASLFGLGVLLYLADASKLPEVSSIASVSGGSITNGFVAQTVDVTQMSDGATFEKAVAPFARQLAQRGTLFASRTTWVYVAVLALTGLAALVGPWFVPVAGVIQFLILVGALLVWAGFVASRRSWIAARAFRETLFSPGGTPTLLRDITGSVDHVFCATDLQSAEQVYFSKTFVYGYRFGLGNPGDLPLHDAVQASACLPGAFPPRWLRTDPLGFAYPADLVHPEDPCPEPTDRPPERPRYMVLTDGGVYDNMADQWALGFRGRRRCWPDLERDHNDPQDLVVVNSSAGLGWVEFKRSIIPGLGELLSLLKVKDVLYDQTTATRRRMLKDRSDRALRATEGLRVGLVNIPQSPFDVAKEFARYSGPPAERARAALSALGDTESEWTEVARKDAMEVGTSLSKMGTEISARLLHHAYVLAMANLHVLLDYPLLTVPNRQRFADFVSGTSP